MPVRKPKRIENKMAKKKEPKKKKSKPPVKKKKKKPALKKKSDDVHVAGLTRPLTQIELVGVHRFTRNAQQKLRSRKSDSVQFASPKPAEKSSSRVK